jgi:hypothetical protein
LVEKFIRLALTKSRKQEMPITFVAHNNTQLALGNIKGLSSLISKMLQLQLKAEVDSVSLKPVSSGKGEVKLDSSDTWLPVLLPRFDKKITNFGSPINPKNSVQTIQITNSECAENVEGKLEEAERAIIEVLTKSPRHTLWEIATEEFEIQDAETVKDFLEKIGELIINKELVSLSDKFKIQSRTDVRYSYSGYSKKVAQTHRKANNKCCCCSKKKSEQIHHTRYEGANDEPGINLFPVCLDCHKTICHSPQNWSQNPVWGSQNTPEFCDRLKLEFSFLVSQDC